jgi:hypothetical protein
LPLCLHVLQYLSAAGDAVSARGVVMKPSLLEWAIAVAVAGLPSVGLVAVALASGERDFCYIERWIDSDSPGYMLKSNRPWRPDETLMRGATFEEAVSAAERIGCPLK